MSSDANLAYKETYLRTTLRTISYRFWVMVFLFVTGFIFELSIDILIKYAVLGWTMGFVMYFVHEKVWNLFDYGKDQLDDQHRRTLVKTICWRALSFIAIFVVGITLGVESTTSFGYSIVSNISFVVVHYAHERAWNVWGWGKYQPVGLG